jgi:hypothetical protein
MWTQMFGRIQAQPEVQLEAVVPDHQQGSSVGLQRGDAERLSRMRGRHSTIVPRDAARYGIAQRNPPGAMYLNGMMGTWST